MNNITILCIEAIICLVTILLLYKKYKIEGIYAYTIIAMILSSLMSLKTITIYEFELNLGIIPFVTIFIATNMLIQKKGTEETKPLILTLVTTSTISYIIIFLISYMNSSDINLFTNASYDNIFTNSLRIYFAMIVTILYTLLLDTKIYYYLKKIKNNILISNLFSAIIIQFLASILFCIIAYTFVREPVDIIKIIMIRYLISLAAGLLGTITVYILKYIK